MNSWTTKWAVLVLFCSWAAIIPILAQGDRGSISGRISDSSDAKISHADVTLTDESTGVSLKSKSNDLGEFTFSALNPGRYKLLVTAQGFGAYSQEHIQIDVGSSVQSDVKMNVGSSSTEITVTADAQQLQYSSANLGMVVDEKSMTDLPLVYGNAFALGFLAPGVTLSSVNPNLHVYDSGTSSVSVNGSSLNSIDYKLDGAADNRIRTTAFTPNTESISQYRMSTATYDASQGHASGGFVNVQTKSGTDAIHGSVYTYYQNPKINSNTWMLNPTTSQTKPKFTREGFSLGAPILRQKLFFFAGYEHSYQVNPDVDTLQVPTQKEIAGDFSDALALDTTSGTATCNEARVYGQKETANAYQIFDARSGAYNGKNYARTCIPGNKLTAYTTIDPVAKAILAYYPAPTSGNTAIGSYSYSIAQPDTYNGEIIRVDYNLNAQQSMYLHLLKSERLEHEGQYFGKISGTDLDYKNWGVALGHTIVLNSSTVLSTVLSYTRFVNQNVNAAQGTVSPTTVGMASNLISGLPASASAFPRVSLSSYDALNTSSSTLGEDDIWLGSVGLSKQIGSHWLRTGVEYRRYVTSGMSGQTENGSYSSSGTLSTQYNGDSVSKSGAVLSIAEIEQGLINSGSQTQNSDFLTRSEYWSAFLQDDWRLSKRLTLNLGLRWEHERPMRELNGKEIVSFDFNAANSTTSSAAAAYATTLASGKSTLLPSSINPTGGVIFANTNGHGPDPYKMQQTNFSPRVGFSYAINDKTVVRGGYGIFFDNLVTYYLSGGNGGSTTTFLVPQQGYSATSNVTAPTYTNGAATNGVVTNTGNVTITSTLANPFPSGLTAVTGKSSGYNTALGQDIQFLQPSPKLTYNERMSFGVQHQFGKFIMSADYVGSMGRHLLVSQISTGTNYGGRDYNPVPRSYLSKLSTSYDALENYNMSTNTVPNPFYGLVPSNSTNSLSSSTIGVAQLLRPRPEFGRINAYTTDGMSSYNSVQVQLQRRFASSLSTTAAFTYSHSLDATNFLNPSDPKPWYGLSRNDRPLRFTVSAVYQLPWGHGRHWLAQNKGVVAQLVGGWQIQGVYQIQSGAPLNFTGNDVYYGTNPGASAWSRSSYRKSQVGGSNPVGGYWFNPANWLTSQSGVSGTHTVTCPTFDISDSTTYTCSKAFPGTYQIRTFVPRYGQLRADHLNQGDIGLQRQFKIWKSSMMQLRCEAVNVLNHPVYSAPSTDPTNSLFGQIQSQANQPRVYQFAGFIRF